MGILSQKVALVTGSDSGIGRAIALQFASEGAAVVVNYAHNQPKAEEVRQLIEKQGGRALVLQADLSQYQQALGLVQQTVEQLGRLDILVNNAGYGKFGEFAKLPLEEDIGMIQLNMVTLTILTKLFLGPMLERGSGRIMNVASTAGFQPGPLMAVYYATKAYVISLSEALASELQGSGVTVTCLCPGATDTEFQKRAGTENTALFRKLRPMDAQTVARAGYRGLMSGQTLVIPGFRNRLLAESVRFGPRKLVTAISRKILQQVE